MKQKSKIKFNKSSKIILTIVFMLIIGAFILAATDGTKSWLNEIRAVAADEENGTENNSDDVPVPDETGDTDTSGETGDTSITESTEDTVISDDAGDTSVDDVTDDTVTSDETDDESVSDEDESDDTSNSFELNELNEPVLYALDDPVTLITINSSEDLINYSNAYRADPSAYQNIDVSIAITAGNLSNLDGFVSIGTAEYPFAARLIIASSIDLSVTLDKPLFAYILDSAQIQDSYNGDTYVTISRQGSADTPLFAENVVHDPANTSPANWTINIESGNLGSFSGVIGTLGVNANVDLTVKNSLTNADIVSAGDVGIACQRMEEGSALTVSISGTNTGYNVTSESGNAGGLAGRMESGSVLTVNSEFSNTGEITADSGYAGGLAGYVTDAVVKFNDYAKVSGNVSGGAGTGGVFGYYRNTAENNEFDISKYDVSCTLNGENSGGVFGKLDNGGNMTITASSDIQIAPKRTSAEKMTYGGLVGTYLSDHTSNSLTVRGTIKDITVSVDKGSGYAENYGGFIGCVDDDSYVKFEKVVVNANYCGTNVTYFGGLVGYVNNAFIDAENVTINTNGKFIGGGIVGNMNSGVLRLGEKTDLSSAPADKGGQIVGTRGNQALIYARDGWQFIRSTTAAAVDDIGTWGEVLRFGGSLSESSVLDVNETEHTVTVNPPSTNAANLSDFAKLALNIQMNNGQTAESTLIFADTSNTSDVLLCSDITLSGNIDLSGTGITGLTRDDGKNADGNNEIMLYTGTFDGGDHTLTLAAGEPYGYRGNASSAIGANDTTAGNGIIYRHYYIGLFAATADGAKFCDLSVDGFIGLNYTDNVRYYIGGLSSRHEKGSFTAENVTVSEKINYLGSGGTYNFAGGMIGNIPEDSDPVVTINNCVVNTVISGGSSDSKFICGGAIGEINTTQSFSIDVNNLKLGSDITNKSNADGKKTGGFIGNISNYDGNDPGTRTISLKNITIDGATVESNSNKSNYGGALLGEAWNNAEVTVGSETESGITVKNSKVIQTGPGGFAGIVTVATGYWKVYNIDIQSIKAEGGSAGSFGIIVNNGKYSDYNQIFALYLELENENAFKISSADLTLLNTNAAFDELLTTCTGVYSNNNSLSENGICAVVSIHTSGDKVIMDGTSCNTYQNQTGRAVSNPNTRYYYNLDVMRAKDSASITAPEKLMLWSVNAYAYDNIKKYFENPFEDNKITADIYDMTGYSYYPIDSPADITIEGGSTFIFCNDKIENSENGTGNTDNAARTTTDEKSQHYFMHFGIFRDITESLNLSGEVTLGGCVGSTSDGSGALVCGTVFGSNQNQAEIRLNGVILDGIKVNGDTSSSGYTPLLINKIDSYTDLSLSNVMTTENYTSGGTTLTAATSLIGDAGNNDGNSVNIKLTFSELTIDGRKSAVSDTDANNALDSAYKTKNSIFSKATLLNSFKFEAGSNCSGSYNFKLNEDWNENGSARHNVTYGSEISDSAEYDGLQEKYLKSDIFTDPTKPDAESEYSFGSCFLPYVAAKYTATNNYHEIKVNQSIQADLDMGCGTYNDPYIISSGKQLELMDKILRGNFGVSEDGTIINYTADNYRSWCAEKNSHTALIWNSGTGAFVSDDSSTSLQLSEMQDTLAAAYYKINNDVTVSSADFVGIGKNVAFKGVIYGNDKTIINKTTNPLIFQSKGTVIKDLNVEIEADFTGKFQGNAKSKYETDENGSAGFYGGLIGIVNGGDNIIDKVSVSFTDSDTLNIRSGSCYGNKAMGGYIGVVRFGGVIFRNMDNVEPEKRAGITKNDNSMFNSEGDLKDNTGKILLYCNPIIGRVIDGFAVTESDSYKPHEGATMNNGTKNYYIADIDKSSPYLLSFNDKIINIPDSQSLFLMGCIAMSGAGSAGWYGDYSDVFSYGNSQMVRCADYDKIGDPDIDETYTDFLIAKEDNFENGTETVPYIIYKYTEKNAGNYPARSLTKNDGTNCVFTLEMAQDNIYDLPDSFRGIGSLNNASNDLKMNISGLNGNNAVVKLNSNFYAYKKGYDQYYVANSSNTNQNVGLGLFTDMVQKSGTVSDLTLSGNAAVKIYNSEGSSEQASNGNAPLCAGMLAGTSNYSTINIQNVILSDASVDTRSISGGLIGFINNDGSGNSSVMDCKNTNSLTVNGGDYAGGLVGYINGGRSWTISNITLSEINIITNTGHINGTGDKVGAGGLIGYKAKALNAGNITVENSNIESQGSAGGIICRVNGNNTTDFFDCNVINTNVGSENTMFTGGILGLSHSNSRVNFTRCKVSGNAGTHNTIQGSYQAGGLSTWMSKPGTADGCVIENYDIKLYPERLNSSYSETCGGFFSKTGNDAVLKNSRISNCNIIRDKNLSTNPVGGIIGFIGDKGSSIGKKTIYGYNIAMDNVQIMDSNGNALTTGDYGDIGGHWGTAKFVGLSMQKTEGGVYAGKNFGDASGYVIYADYNGVCLDETAANTEPSTINQKTIVDDMGAFPYVTVNPVNQIDNTTNSPRFLTGDGADKSAVDSILSEIDSAYGYTNASSEYSDTFKDYEGKRSTFNEKTGAGIANDFPVLVINESSYSNVTNMLNSYIHILTNDTSISNYANADSNICNVDILPFRLNESSGIFETKTEYKNTLECNNGYFRITDKDYDSNYKQFTLIDIQYYDPSGTGKIAYHLYIPVYVEKMLEFDFRAAALSGTIYNTSFYTDGNPVLESYGTPVTAHITYSYRRTAEEWQNVINSGENLLNGYGKSVLLKSKNDLPGNTKLVIVDKNNSDKAYYSAISDAFTASDEKLDFSKFKTSDGEVFVPVSFCDLLSRAADITVNADTAGTLVKCGADDRAEACIRIGGEYYRKRSDADTSTSDLYSAKVTAKGNMTDTSTGILKVDEEYYISFFTETDNDAPMRNIILTCSSRLGDDNMIPSHLSNENSNESMVHMILGNLYDQTFTFKTTGGVIINENNKAVNASLETTVSLKPENAGEVKPYLNDASIHLYHGFIIEATRNDETLTEKGVKGSPQVTGTYKIGDSAYNQNFSNSNSVISLTGSNSGGLVDIKNHLINNSSITISCDDLQILYSDEESIIAQFPERKKQDETYGVTWSANSSLAYVPDNIEQSNITEIKNDESGKSYYRENIAAASLNYNIPVNSPNELTKLGINGREANEVITAVGYYNILNIPEEDFNKAKKVKFTLSLYQKNDDGIYIPADIDAYLKNVRLYDKNGVARNYTVNNDSFDFIFDKGDDLNFEAGSFEVISTYSVITGAEFESAGKTYSNYKVQLTAQLLDENGNSIANSSCSDYIIYTNAKIFTELISGI